MNLVLTKLEATSHEDEGLIIPEPKITEITEESNPDVWEILQPPNKAEENAIASDPAEPETEISSMVIQTSEQVTEVKPSEEETSLDRIEPVRASEETGTLVLQEVDKRSLIHQQASMLNVSLNTAELTTVVGHIADNYTDFEDACRQIKSIILMVLDQRFERASDVLDDTLLTIVNRAAGNFQSLNGRATQEFAAIAQELNRMNTDFKSSSSELKKSLRKYLIK